jgi:Golgi phosphoprotein 3 (GPP34)
VNLAEELKLCSIDEHGHAFSTKIVAGLGGALAAELILAGRISIDEGSIALRDPTPTGDGLVDAALDGLGQHGDEAPSPASWISRVGVTASPRVHEGLVQKGLVTVERGGRSWLLVVRRSDRYRITPAGEDPRHRLRAVLTGETDPDARTASLAGLVSVCGVVDRFIDGRARAAARHRAAELAADQAVSESVRAAIEASRSATASAAMSAALAPVRPS